MVKMANLKPYFKQKGATLIMTAFLLPVMFAALIFLSWLLPFIVSKIPFLKRFSGV